MVILGILMIMMNNNDEKHTNIVNFVYKFTILRTIISKHLKGCMVPRVSTSRFWTKRILLFSLFLDTFSCSKDFAVSLFPDTFHNQGILSFPCFWTLSIFKSFFVSLFPDTLNFQKYLETGKTTKSFEKIIIVKGFCHFSWF